MKKNIKHDIIGLKELRDNTETYIREIEKGKSFLVMRRSQPIFKIAPADEWGDTGMWDTAIDFNKMKKGGISVVELLKKLHTPNESSPQIS
ncbi:MAG: hypothetical protein AAB637_00260 [Patescibacteria group bacterium]